MKKVSLNQIKEILRKVGYSEEKIKVFHEKFFVTLMVRVGEEAKKEFTSEEIKNITDALDDKEKGQKVQKIVLNGLEEMINEVLEKILQNASSKDMAIINEVLD